MSSSKGKRIPPLLSISDGIALTALSSLHSFPLQPACASRHALCISLEDSSAAQVTPACQEAIARPQRPSVTDMCPARSSQHCLDAAATIVKLRNDSNAPSANSEAFWSIRIFASLAQLSQMKIRHVNIQPLHGAIASAKATTRYLSQFGSSLNRQQRDNDESPAPCDTSTQTNPRRR